MYTHHRHDPENRGKRGGRLAKVSGPVICRTRSLAFSRNQSAWSYGSFKPANAAGFGQDNNRPKGKNATVKGGRGNTPGPAPRSMLQGASRRAHKRGWARQPQIKTAS